ncbi:MAG: hypothetical protein R3D25_02575 [Geminicoccaceae bacterium]
MTRRPVTALLLVVSLPLAGCMGTGQAPDGPAALYTALGDDDVALAAATLQRSLESEPQGGTARWRNPASGNQGSITPRDTYVSDSGHFCRVYDEELTFADGRSGTIVNAACRGDSGRWVWLAG